MEYKFENDGDFKKVRLGKRTTHKTLSDQALGAVMMALQNSLMHQTDIVPVLKEMKFTDLNGELVVLNPPIVKDTTDNA